MPKRFLSVSEAAALLRVHPTTLRRALHLGQIPYVAVGRKLLIPAALLARLAGEELTILDAHGDLR